MPTGTDVRKYTDTARKPLLAWVGATDLAYDRLRTQLKDLPATLTLDPREATTRVRHALEGYAAQGGEAEQTGGGQQPVGRRRRAAGHRDRAAVPGPAELADVPDLARLAPRPAAGPDLGGQAVHPGRRGGAPVHVHAVRRRRSEDLRD